MIRVNLIGLPKQRRRARVPVFTLEGNASLLILAVVILAAAGYAYYQVRALNQEIERLTVQKAELDREFADLGRIKEEFDVFSRQKDLLTRRINVIEGLQSKRAGPVRLLTTVARAATTSDALFLSSVIQAGQNITVEGTALNVKAVADFITQLINTRMFSEVDLRETAQDTTDRERERFQFILNTVLAAPPATTPTT